LKVKILVPLVDSVKIPEQRFAIIQFLGLPSDAPIVMHVIDTLQPVEASDTVDVTEDYPRVFVGDNLVIWCCIIVCWTWESLTISFHMV